MLNKLYASVFLGFILTGCIDDVPTELIEYDEDRDGGDTASDGNTGSLGVGGNATQQEGCNAMDILFVIDDSGSMSEEQANLGANFPAFFDVIHEYETKAGESLDYHVGFTTTGITKYRESNGPGGQLTMIEEGDDGALVNGSCSQDIGWITRETENADTLFGCVSNVGISGPVDEMPLEAMRLSITTEVRNGVNAGFYRDDALLGIVILTDEDDQSIKTAAVDGSESTFPIEAYVAGLDHFKGDRAKWAVAAINGGSNGCSSQLGNAAPAPRLEEFILQTGENAIQSSICEADFSIALRAALDTFEAACENFPNLE